MNYIHSDSSVEDVMEHLRGPTDFTKMITTDEIIIDATLSENEDRLAEAKADIDQLEGERDELKQEVKDLEGDKEKLQRELDELKKSK